MTLESFYSHSLVLSIVGDFEIVCHLLLLGVAFLVPLAELLLELLVVGHGGDEQEHQEREDI